MEDSKIIDLYFARDEKAIYETQIKYGPYCYAISYNILHNNEDCQECVSDAYLDTWNAIPPHRPSILSTFIGKITRRISIDKYRKLNAKKRSNGEFELSLDELEECIASNSSVQDKIDEQHLVDSINSFLAIIKKEDRKIFICRYFYFDSIADITKRFNYSESKVKMSLKRTRDKLKDYLIKEGYTI